MYKTMILGLLRQRREFHHQLKAERKLLQTIDEYAMRLKESHEAWEEQLAQARPSDDQAIISSEALEFALKDLEDSLPTGSHQDEESPLSLDEAMAFIRQNQPR